MICKVWVEGKTARPPDYCMSLVLMTELPTRVLYPTKSETEINDPTGPLRPYEHCFLGVAKIQTWNNNTQHYFWQKAFVSKKMTLINMWYIFFFLNKKQVYNLVVSSNPSSHWREVQRKRESEEKNFTTMK